jgi:hypothetical protein
MKQVLIAFYISSFVIFSTSAQSNYLIIYPDFLVEEAEQFGAYRTTTGCTVDLVDLTSIANGSAITNDIIDDWIEDYVSQNTELEYIVLFGNTHLIPTFHSFYDGDLFDSDLWYAVMNDSLNPNYLPTIKLGRLPVGNASQALRCLEKIQRFEEVSDSLNTFLFFGMAAEMQYARNRDMQIAYDAGYDTISLISPSETELYNVLNTLPIKAVFYYGHGGLINNPPLDIYNMHEWTNFDRPVLYFSGGCDFSFNYPGTVGYFPPLGDTLMTSTFGSITSVGASINGGYGYDYKFIQGIMREIDEYDRMGGLYNRALEYHHNVSGSNAIGSWVYYFTRRMNFVGDPYLKIGSPITYLPDIKDDRYVKIFPNPTRGNVVVDLETARFTEVKTNLYTIGGVLIQSGFHTSEKFTVEMTKLEAGIYVLHLQDRNGKLISIQKIIKK